MVSRRGVMAGLGLALAGGACSVQPAGPSLPFVTPRPKQAFKVAGVTDVRRVAQPTGPGAIDDTSKVALAGCDLGPMFTAGNRTWFLFGDNFR